MPTGDPWRRSANDRRRRDRCRAPCRVRRARGFRDWIRIASRSKRSLVARRTKDTIMSLRGASRQLHTAPHRELGERMQWLGKGIGGLVGALFGPVGSLVGVLIGHQWDQSKNGARRGSVQEISRLFFETTFEVMGRVAKIDGRVSEDEVRVARSIMHGMRLTDEQVQYAIEHFTRGKSVDFPLDDRVAALAEQLGGRGDLARAFVQIQ